MTLGQNIARLRAERRLSQGELADALEVSRQSISKWETDASVPELEKLVKLSALFEVSLDELVKGESEKKEETPEAAAVPPEQKGGTQRIVGTILVCFGVLLTVLFMLLGGGFAGLIFGLPFLACGFICLWCRRHTGLWCAWAVYGCVDLYLRYATGLTWNVVLQTFRWEASMNYMRLAIGWGQFLALAAMIFATLHAFRTYAPKNKSGKLLALGWAGFLLLRNAPGWIEWYFIKNYGMQAVAEAWYFRGYSLFVSTAISYLCLALLCALLIRTRAWLKTRKKDG